MLKMKIQVEGDPHEDSVTIKVFAHSLDMHAAIEEAEALIRKRWKHTDVSADEYTFLSLLLDALSIEER